MSAAYLSPRHPLRRSAGTSTKDAAQGHPVRRRENSLMTLVISWLRTVKNARECVVASDSRLSGGFTLDCAQKILPVCGGRFALAFSGDSGVSYPLFIHALSFSESYGRAKTGAVDVSDFAEKLLTIFRIYTAQLEDAAETPKEFFGKTFFLLSGWSWKFSAFRIYHYRFTAGDWEKGRVTPSRWETADGEIDVTLKVIGTEASRVAGEFRRSVKGMSTEEMNLEPLEFLWDRLADLGRRRARGSVGGPLQMVKCYPYLQVLPFAVSWGENGDSHLFGRRLEDYERVQYPIISRTNGGFETLYPRISHERATRSGADDPTDIATWPDSEPGAPLDDNG